MVLSAWSTLAAFGANIAAIFAIAGAVVLAAVGHCCRAIPGEGQNRISVAPTLGIPFLCAAGRWLAVGPVRQQSRNGCGLSRRCPGLFVVVLRLAGLPVGRQSPVAIAATVATLLPARGEWRLAVRPSEAQTQT